MITRVLSPDGAVDPTTAPKPANVPATAGIVALTAAVVCDIPSGLVETAVVGVEAATKPPMYPVHVPSTQAIELGDATVGQA